ncbi:MAG: hypothetical protein QXX35_00440 [Desulfurococcaceae archaeon]
MFEKYIGLILLLLGYILAIVISIFFGLKLYRKTLFEEESGGK